MPTSTRSKAFTAFHFELHAAPTRCGADRFRCDAGHRPDRSQRRVMPAKSNSSPGPTRTGRLRPDARNVRLATVPAFQRQLPPISKPWSQVYDELSLNRCAIEPGWTPSCCGARGSSQITSPWKSAFESELVFPVASP